MDTPQWIVEAHANRNREMARSLYNDALNAMQAFENQGNVTRAYAKRLQARYWGKRAYRPYDPRFDKQMDGVYPILAWGWIDHGDRFGTVKLGGTDVRN